MDIVRPQYKPFKVRLEEKRKFIQIISGPRQVGKTTLVRQLLAKLKCPSVYLNADTTAARRESWLDVEWNNVRAKQRESGKDFVLVIDEIQKVNDWTNQVKFLWDEDSQMKRPIKLVLLGSNSLLLQQGLSESLAGRFELLQLPHWSYAEMREAFDFTLEQYVWFGAYPGAASLIKNEKRWKAYIKDSLIETTVSKDILQMVKVDKPALLRNVLELSCHYSGQIFAFNKMLGQLHGAGNTTTLSVYLKLLESAGLVCGLSKFSNSKERQRSSSPKLQVLNMALMSALSDYTFKEIKLRPDKWGRWIESAVGAHIINSGMTETLEYWREGNDEVDFVLRNGKSVIGIEVKSGIQKSFYGMDQFKKKFSPEKLLLVGDNGIKIEKFLLMNSI